MRQGRPSVRGIRMEMLRRPAAPGALTPKGRPSPTKDARTEKRGEGGGGGHVLSRDRLAALSRCDYLAPPLSDAGREAADVSRMPRFFPFPLSLCRVTDVCAQSAVPSGPRSTRINEPSERGPLHPSSFPDFTLPRTCFA